MEESSAASVLSHYENLEGQLIDFLKYVPFHHQNLNVWSPRLAGVITESCALMDSVLRHLSPERVTIGVTEKPRSKLTFADYVDLYFLSLRDRRVIFLSSPPEYVQPFWKISRSATPHWWTVNNCLKESCVEHYELATLEVAILCLGALALVLASRSELAAVLARSGWIGNLPRDAENLAEHIKGGVCEVTIETRLFAIWLGNRELPEDIEEFKPVLYGASPHLMDFFGK